MLTRLGEGVPQQVPDLTQPWTVWLGGRWKAPIAVGCWESAPPSRWGDTGMFI
jgi:hypothetical protein